MAKDHEGMCGMHLCGKCTWMVLVFGIIFLIAGLGLYSAAWFNGWTILGAFLALWGLMPMMSKGM